MPFKDTLKKLQNISDLPGKTDKLALLRGYINHPTFSKTLKLMLSETEKFNIIALPDVDPRFQVQDEDVIFAALEKLAKKKGATDKDKLALAQMVGQDTAAREVVQRILEGSTKAGFGLRSVLKVAPGFMFQTPYQRCSGVKNMDRVTFPAVVQKKADGKFSYAAGWIKTDLFSDMFLGRSGKSFNLFNNLEEEINYYSDRLEPFCKNPIFVGELTVMEPDGSIMSRKKGNGLLNKFATGDGTQEIANRVVYSVWDVIPAEDFKRKECDIPYAERWNALMNAFTLPADNKDAKIFMKNTMETGVAHRVHLIDSKSVKNQKEAQDYYTERRLAGDEGAILKDHNSLWKNNTCPTMVKMKRFVQAEFKITGVAEGKGRLKGKMGALEVASSDDLVQSKVGSGFADDQRDFDYWVRNVGGIITVQFESVITDKKRKKIKSLFTPSFIEERFTEKTEADDLPYLKDLCDDAKQLKEKK